MNTDNNYHNFKVSISSEYEQWWRYNLFLTIIGYDENKNIICHVSNSDRVFDIDNAGDDNHSNTEAHSNRSLSLESAPCSSIEVYLYVITNTFPESALIRESPPFNATLTIEKDGKIIDSSIHEVNQWGGLTISRKPYPAVPKE